MTQEDNHSSSFISLLKMAYEQYRRYVVTEARRAILEPNRNSDVKVERYSMGLSKEIALGSPFNFELLASPDVTFRPQEISMNAPAPSMFMIQGIQVSAVGCIIGNAEDAYNWKRRVIDYPTMTPANRIIICVQYTGRMQHMARLLTRQRDSYAAAAFHLREAMKVAQQQRTIKQARNILGAAIINHAPPIAMPAPEIFTFSISITGPAGLCF